MSSFLLINLIFLFVSWYSSWLKTEWSLQGCETIFTSKCDLLILKNYNFSNLKTPFLAIFSWNEGKNSKFKIYRSNPSKTRFFLREKLLSLTLILRMRFEWPSLNLYELGLQVGKIRIWSLECRHIRPQKTQIFPKLFEKSFNFFSRFWF